MTPTIKHNIRSMVYSIHENDFATAKKHIKDVVKEKIQDRYRSIVQKLDSRKDK